MWRVPRRPHLHLPLAADYGARRQRRENASTERQGSLAGVEVREREGGGQKAKDVSRLENVVRIFGELSCHCPSILALGVCWTEAIAFN